MARDARLGLRDRRAGLHRPRPESSAFARRAPRCAGWTSRPPRSWASWPATCRRRAAGRSTPRAATCSCTRPRSSRCATTRPGLARQRAGHPARARRRRERAARPLRAPVVGRRVLLRLPGRRDRGAPGAAPTGCPTWTPRSPASRWCSRPTPPASWPAPSCGRATCTAPARDPGRCGRWRRCARAGCCCRPWAAGCSARCTWTTWWTGSCSRPRARRARGRCSRSPTASGSPPREFFGHYARLLGRRLRSVPTPVARALAAAAAGAGGERGQSVGGRLHRPARGTYSIEKARSMLGYEPAVDLAEGMRRTVAWLAEEGYGA